VIWLLSLACSSEPSESTEEAAPSPFESCDPAGLEALATEHGFTMVFEPCGSNQFLDAVWSTDGHRLYFRRGMNHQVLTDDRGKQSTKMVPTSIPIGTAVWTTASRLVLPLGHSAEGGTVDRLAVYDAETEALSYFDLPATWSAPTDLMRTDDPNVLLLTAQIGEERKVVRFDLRSKEDSEPFPWLGPVDSFTYTAAGNALLAGKDGTVILYDPTTGKPRGQWSPAIRGTMHPKGEWLVLEHLGAPVSVFQPLGLDRMMPAERDRALQQAEAQAALQPADYPTEVRPPMLSFVNANDAKRYVLTAAQGTRFQWWEGRDYFGSFISWGFERKQLRRNVLLGDLAGRMLLSAEGRIAPGVEDPARTPVDAGAAPAEPSAAPPPTR
jgi:hypothetical protein